MRLNSTDLMWVSVRKENGSAESCLIRKSRIELILPESSGATILIGGQYISVTNSIGLLAEEIDTYEAK